MSIVQYLESFKQKLKQSGKYTESEIEEILGELEQEYQDVSPRSLEKPDIRQGLEERVFEARKIRSRIKYIRRDLIEDTECVRFSYTDGQGVLHENLEWLCFHQPYIGSPYPYCTVERTDSHMKAHMDVSDREIEVIQDYLDDIVEDWYEDRFIDGLRKYKDSVFSNVGELFGNEPAPWTGEEIIEFLIGGDSTSDLYLGTDRYGDFGIMDRAEGMEMKLEEWTLGRADTLGILNNWGAWEYTEGSDTMAVNITGDADSEYGWQTHVLTTEDLQEVIDHENM